MTNPDDRLTRLEEHAASLEHMVQELSAVVAEQAKQIGRMEQQLRLLMEREAVREAEGSGGVVLGDERPPHY